jgi:hypothetical protein
VRPLFGFFQAMTMPVALCASSVDFDGSVLLNPRVRERIQVALADVADLLKARVSSAQAAARHHGRCRSDPGRCRSNRVGAENCVALCHLGAFAD